MMLAQLFSNDAQKKRDPIYGMGLIKAPSTCGALNVSARDQPWASMVTPMPSAVPVSAAALTRPPTASVALDTWQPVVKRASLPLEAGR
jgi:hypothetical protein